jgi:predicted RNA-binding protein YlxR (DUF448 family)
VTRQELEELTAKQRDLLDRYAKELDDWKQLTQEIWKWSAQNVEEQKHMAARKALVTKTRGS